MFSCHYLAMCHTCIHTHVYTYIHVYIHVFTRTSAYTGRLTVFRVREKEGNFKTKEISINIKHSSLLNYLLLWSGFINPPLQPLVYNYFPLTFERLFLKKNPAKQSPHSNLGIFPFISWAHMSSIHLMKLLESLQQNLSSQGNFFRFEISSVFSPSKKTPATDVIL